MFRTTWPNSIWWWTVHVQSVPVGCYSLCLLAATCMKNTRFSVMCYCVFNTAIYWNFNIIWWIKVFSFKLSISKLKLWAINCFTHTINIIFLILVKYSFILKCNTKCCSFSIFFDVYCIYYLYLSVLLNSSLIECFT